MGLFDKFQREQILYHCGYTNATIRSSLSFGQPLPRETMFLITRTIEEWDNQEGLPRILQHVATLDKIECLMVEALDRLSTVRVGNVEIRQDETTQLENEYNRWANRLADTLGVPFYAYSERFKKQVGVMVGNIKMQH